MRKHEKVMPTQLCHDRPVVFYARLRDVGK